MTTVTRTVVASTTAAFAAHVAEPVEHSRFNSEGDQLYTVLLPLDEETFTRITRLVTPTCIDHLRLMAMMNPDLVSIRIEARVQKQRFALPHGLSGTDFMRNYTEQMKESVESSKDEAALTGSMVDDTCATYYFQTNEHLTTFDGEYDDSPFSGLINTTRIDNA